MAHTPDRLHIAIRRLAANGALALALIAPAGAEVIEYDTRKDWAEAAGPTSTIDFTDQPDGAPITDQYESIGMLVSGEASIYVSNLFKSDGLGLFCPDGVEFEFLSPQNWFAIEHAGALMMDLYFDDQLVHTTALFVPLNESGFSGIVSDASFNRVVLFAPAPFNPNLYIDNVHFGSPVPGVGAAALLLGLLARRGRK